MNTFESHGITIHNANCLEHLPCIASGSIDLVLTDPAYESTKRYVGGTTARMGMGREGSGNQNLQDKFYDCIRNCEIPDLVFECHRILRDERHTYFMCDWETLKILHTHAIQDGVFKPWRSEGGMVESCKPLIWDKVSPGMGYTYRATYEFIFMLWKGKKRRLNDLGIADVLHFKRVAGNEKLVPTQKPLDLMKLLICQSTKNGEMVLDPFCGAGTTAIACLHTGRKCLTFEKDTKNFDIAVDRLKSEIK